MSIYNPAPLFVSTHTAYRTISDVILDLQVNWTAADRVESGSVAQGKTMCSGTITASTATLTFQGCSYYPVLAQFSRTVTISLTGDLAEYEDDGIYLVIRRPDVSVQVTDIEVEPYLVMYPDAQTTITPKRRNFNGLHYSLEGLSAAFNQIRNADFIYTMSLQPTTIQWFGRIQASLPAWHRTMMTIYMRSDFIILFWKM